MKTAIVTGASSGIGLGIANALLEHGYSVVANARRISDSHTLKVAENLALVDGDIGDIVEILFVVRPSLVAQRIIGK